MKLNLELTKGYTLEELGLQIMEINTVYMSLEDYQNLILENVDLKEQNEKLKKEKEELKNEYKNIEEEIIDDVMKNNSYYIEKMEKLNYDDYYYRVLASNLMEKGFTNDSKIKSIIIDMKNKQIAEEGNDNETSDD